MFKTQFIKRTALITSIILLAFIFTFSLPAGYGQNILSAQNEAAEISVREAGSQVANNGKEFFSSVKEMMFGSASDSEADFAKQEQQNHESIAFNVNFGERPPIDLAKVPFDAIEEGKISIKLMPQAGLIMEKAGLQYSAAGIALTGIEPLDKLNGYYGVTRFKPLFAGLYDTKGRSSQHKDRHRAWGLHLWHEIAVDTNHDLISVIEAYISLPDVETAEPVYKKQLQWTPDDPQFFNQWHYHNTGQQGGSAGADIDLIRAWDLERGDPAVIVAIIDSGIQYDHPDLTANMWVSRGYNFVTDSSIINPGDHGTHVAGIVAAVSNNNSGVAGIAGGSGTGDGARLMSCQVFDGELQGGFHLAPVYAADNGAAISQNSWNYSTPGVYEKAVLDAIDYFNANGGGTVLDGGISIFSAGNYNDSAYYYPAYYSGTMAVAATNNQDQKAYYSNYGSWVDISAPGGETSPVAARGILSTITGSNYAYRMGTSMACPHVSGVAALMISLAPGELTAAEVHDILKDTADNHYAVNPTFIGQLGTGRLNAYNALQAIISTSTGLVQVNIEPASARQAGARWRLTDGPDTDWKYSSFIMAALPPDTYTITFKDISDVSGWSKPSDININLTAGSELTRTGTYTGQTFSDVPPSHGFFAYIEAIYAAGITTGFTDGTYRPNDPVSRGQMAAFLARALALDISSLPAEPSFPDVSSGHGFYAYIEAIYAAGITTGFIDGTYRPNDSVSRGQMAAFLARALALDISSPPAEPSFPDVSSGNGFYAYIEAIYAAGITTGFSDGTYRPNDPVTRGQMSALLARAFMPEF